MFHVDDRMADDENMVKMLFSDEELTQSVWMKWGFAFFCLHHNTKEQNRGRLHLQDFMLVIF